LLRPLLIGILFIALQGCSPIIKEIRSFADENQYHAGFYLYDPAKMRVLADYQAEKYFTPASNVKILTLYAAGLFLADPLPTFYYHQDSTTTYLWPTGNPSFLNPVLNDTSNYQMLIKADSLVLSSTNFTASRFGPGWAWDDYQYSYSPERSAFPIYSNLATFTLDSVTTNLTITPSFLSDSVAIIEGERFQVERQEENNRFLVTTGPCEDCVRQRPFRLTAAMIARLYSDTLHIPVATATLPLSDEAQMLFGLPQDSVFKVMMQESDNFLAEQLLLQVAGVLTDTLNTSLAIDSLQYYLNEFLPDSVIWVDGSGLSRYNMITPRSVVSLWSEVLDIFGRERLLHLVSVGGKSGTIKNWYMAEQPYIYGKTGTLRHNHNLSGILITKKGKLLLFAYMNNHYPSGSSAIKKEMEQVLHRIYEKY
jgi:serine-type D-Ala-D-Ala carboxypeptidase/endopeptidase (penicillin-binding protein 4)